MEPKGLYFLTDPKGAVVGQFILNLAQAKLLSAAGATRRHKVYAITYKGFSAIEMVVAEEDKPKIDLII